MKINLIKSNDKIIIKIKIKIKKIKIYKWKNYKIKNFNLFTKFFV